MGAKTEKLFSTLSKKNFWISLKKIFRLFEWHVLELRLLAYEESNFEGFIYVVHVYSWNNMNYEVSILDCSTMYKK